MRTRRSYFLPTSMIPRRSKKQTTNVVEPEFRTIFTMADNRTMAQMFQATIEGYEDAIVVPQINANNFELKQTLINLVQSNQFTGRQDPHNHLRFFNKVTSTLRHPEERLWDELYKLETSMEDVEGVCGVAAFMEKKEEMWPFLGPRNVLRMAIEVPDEQHLKTTGVDEGTGTIPGVPDVPIYESESEKESWGDSGEKDEDNESDSINKSDGDDNDDGSSDDHDDDSDDTEFNRDEIPDPSLTNIHDEEYIDEEEEDEVTKELYDDVVTNLEKALSEIKQVDQYAQALSFIPAIVDRYMDNKLRKSKNKAIQVYNFDCREEAQAKKREYIELVDQRSRDNKDKDQDPSAGSDRGTKRWKSNKDVESSKDSRGASHTVEDSGMQQDQEFIMGDNDDQPADKEVTKADWFKKPERPPTPNHDWNLSRRYSTSVTKTKAATYELKWIEDLVPKLRRIIMVTRPNIMKKYDYGHLKEIEVRRDDQKLYTFRECDFKRLCIQDIEDMLLLLIQQKLTNLKINERHDLNVALHMYTRRIVIQRRVKDLQLGVKSCQKKLNLTKPDTYRSNLRNKTAYTSYSDPYRIIYVDQYRRKRLMHTDKLHKFSDGALNDVRSALYDIAAGIRMEYLPMRKWSNLDKKRDRVMVQDIDKQLYQRRLMGNLEKFVGGREYENDLRLLERTI
nr:reverse transcriptase domain-containing protein [Tanacetum cinerariifolium]